MKKFQSFWEYYNLNKSSKMFKPSIFEDIINKLYGENPYQGLKNLQPTELPQINGRLFELLIKIIQPQIILDMGSEKGESAGAGQFCRTEKLIDKKTN